MEGEKTCNLTLSWAIEWPSWIRTSEEMMEYIKKYYRKKNMKKKMTKKEAFEYLNDRKIYVNGKSKEIQKKLFEAGFHWACGSILVKYENIPFLYTRSSWISYGSNMIDFVLSSKTEISAEEILAIEIQEEKPKYEEELAKMAQPIRDYMRKHNISGRFVVCQSSIAVEDMRFIYPNNSED